MSGALDKSSLVYPAPTLVIGVGRLGLAVLERLGEDWYDLARAGADPSLHNLRLLQVSPEGGDDTAWRRRERETAVVADYVGDSDLPSLALDLAILRSLGLVRYRNGSYQVAVPQDGGVYNLEEFDSDDSGGEAHTEPAGKAPDDPAEDARPRLRRLRYFAWRELSPDPVVAAERLKRLTDRNSDLDLFVTPILNRVRQGHSPGTLLACVARAAALRDGRDPSPWGWVAGLVEAREPGEDAAVRLEFGPDERRRAERLLGLHVEFDIEKPVLDRTAAAAPLPGWKEWRRAVVKPPAGDGNPTDTTPGEGASEKSPLRLRIPGPFVPTPHDTHSRLDLHSLLRLDWETTGWVTDITEGSERPPFLPIPASSFRLGLFDHDGHGEDGSRDSVAAARFAERLRQLGTLVHQGLVRLWIDLHRERVEERHPVLDNRRREHDEEALRQSLEILGELLVRGLHDSLSGCPEIGSAAEECGLPRSPSKFLESIELERSATTSEAVSALNRRLAALGLDDGLADRRQPLLRQIRLGIENGAGGGHAASTEPRLTGLPALRRSLNRKVRRLFDVDTLASYRNWPTRRPPRLTVFLVGDMGEPFVRTAMRPLMREVHAELLRAFGPILEYFREGFDRGLSVTPILWMPHPADPFEGGAGERDGDGSGAGRPGHGDGGRCEEAAIITAVQGIRRWVESVIPPTRRRVSQIFINSRVTDVAVLDPRDAVRQTRDFITFQIRNDLSRDEWLRRTAEGPAGDDFFASFTCYEIDFPAEKAREYLANRLARDCLRRLKSASGDEEPPQVPQHLLHPPHLGDQVAQARRRLGDAVEPAADRIAMQIEERCELRRETPLHRIEDCFDRSFEDVLLDRIQRDWEELSRARGGMDALVDDLRQRTSELLSKRVVEVQRHGDRLIETHAAGGGVQAAIAAFRHFRESAHRSLQRQEEERQRREEVAKRHSVPATDDLATARRRVLDAARRRPDETPIRCGFLLWLLLAPVLGAPLSHALAYALGLHRHPNWIEPLLGPGGWAVGGALLLLTAWAGVRWFQRRRHRDLLAAVAAMARTGRRILEGEGRRPAEESRPSVRSFLESRLLLTEGLAARGFALRIFERAEADKNLAERLNHSIDIQATLLAQQAEDLGIRPTLRAGTGGSLTLNPEGDDVSALFATRSGQRTERLIAPERLVDLYHRWAGVANEEVEAILPRLLHRAGGFATWRESACLSDTAGVLAVGKEEFSTFVDTPLPSQDRLADEVGRRLCRFVARYYANMGFGARFTGYEGLDPDGVQVSADASLVLHEDLARMFEEARSRPGAPRTTATMRVITKPVRPGSAYMLSLAQGIRAHSVRNLKRFESFHGRPHLPEDRTFPVSEELEGPSLNLLSSFTDLSEALDRRFRERPDTEEDDAP